MSIRSERRDAALADSNYLMSGLMALLLDIAVYRHQLLRMRKRTKAVQKQEPDGFWALVALLCLSSAGLLFGLGVAIIG